MHRSHWILSVDLYGSAFDPINSRGSTEQIFATDEDFPGTGQGDASLTTAKSNLSLSSQRQDVFVDLDLDWLPGAFRIVTGRNLQQSEDERLRRIILLKS